MKESQGGNQLTNVHLKMAAKTLCECMLVLLGDR